MKTKKYRILGIPNRYWILLFVILGFFGARLYAPIMPNISVPAEAYPGWVIHIGNYIFIWTNTLTAMVIADILLVLLALAVRRAAKSGQLIPKGISGAVEALLEVIHNLTEAAAGKWTKAIFPFFATITLLVLVVNWTELIPGVDSVGFLESPTAGATAFPVKQLIGSVYTIVKDDSGQNLCTPQEGHAENQEGAETTQTPCTVVPYVRVLSTDLNFTIALALISVVMTQVLGTRSLGRRYYRKFFNTGGVFSRPIFGIIDFGVGLLEIVSEFSKILSFSFRLFGNIFAGSVLLFVIGTLIPVFAQSIFLMLEFAVGLIQAVIFGMLTMIFMAQATAGHGEHAEETH